MESYINFLLRFERLLSKIGYFPLIGTATGLLRLFLAQVQLFFGTLCFFGGIISAVVTWIVRARDASHTCIRLAQFGKIQSVHAGFNTWRGFFELFPVVGGGLCFIYDRAMRHQQLIPYLPGPALDI